MLDGNEWIAQLFYPEKWEYVDQAGISLLYPNFQLRDADGGPHTPVGVSSER